MAAYRERWQVHAGVVLGEEPRSHEQTAQQQSAQHAVSTALWRPWMTWLETCGPQRRSWSPETADSDYWVVLSCGSSWKPLRLTEIRDSDALCDCFQFWPFSWKEAGEPEKCVDQHAYACRGVRGSLAAGTGAVIASANAVGGIARFGGALCELAGLFVYRAVV